MTVKDHLTLEGEGLRVQRKIYGWTVYMESYVANYKQCFMVYWNLRLVHFHACSTIPGHNQVPHTTGMAFGSKSKGTHKHMVVALGSTVKWPLKFLYFILFYFWHKTWTFSMQIMFILISTWIWELWSICMYTFLPFHVKREEDY